jgi:hypothetical protein
MMKQTTELIEIKKTKSVAMFHDPDRGGLQIYMDTGDGWINDSMFIPANKVFQVQRGITSYLARFYRKHIKRA